MEAVALIMEAPEQLALRPLALDAPTVWETDPLRRAGAVGYTVVSPDEDSRRDYHSICDASGDSNILDTLLSRLARGGEINLAGFYSDRLNFAFPVAFRAEARIRVAAEWSPGDLDRTRDLIRDGRLDLGGLVTDVRPASEAAEAYPAAFTDRNCLKMVLDWSNCA